MYRWRARDTCIVGALAILFSKGVCVFRFSTSFVDDLRGVDKRPCFVLLREHHPPISRPSKSWLPIDCPQRRKQPARHRRCESFGQWWRLSLYVLSLSESRSTPLILPVAASEPAPSGTIALALSSTSTSPATQATQTQSSSSSPGSGKGSSNSGSRLGIPVDGIIILNLLVVLLSTLLGGIMV